MLILFLNNSNKENEMAKPTFQQVMEAIAADNGTGFCMSCGEEAYLEPDVRRYKCDKCGEHKGYGAEEMLIMIDYDPDNPARCHRTPPR